MDRKTRKLLTIYWMSHPKADVDRIYISRNEGGCGLIQLECTYKITTIGLETHLKMKKDKLLRQVYHHEKSKKLYSVQKEATRFKKDIQMQDTETGENESATQIARHTKECAKKRIMETISKNWKAKPMQGQYPE